ncbi:glycosyltransferase family 25 protein [Aeromonas veronii]|uniref:glycosyltransferase family 25 protein n=1 Tax=Aeromonas veronii TaxID=654 RepID=UPI0024448ABA|nr:glycosyltransferase family 25 protein [Aeromonas veronii]
MKIINDLFGDALYAEMAKAKVIVNIHYYEGALLETTRIYECLSQNKIIVSEESADMDEYSELLPLVDFVPVNDIQAMVEKVEHWVSSDVARKERNNEIRKGCADMPDMFSYYFLRLFLAHDLITYDDFYKAVGHVIQFDTDMICLGLPETTARKVDFEKDNHYGIQYIPGLRHRLGWIGCGLSYKFLINRAKDLNFPQITICEDDVLLPDDFSSRLNEIKKYLSGKENWDVFAGLIADLHDDVKILNIEDVDNECYVHIDKMVSMVTNIYSNKFYDKLLAWDSCNHDPQSNTIDRFIEQHDDVHTIVTSRYLVGHKEDLNSTLWGISNMTYKKLIQNSENKLQDKIAAYKAN